MLLLNFGKVCNKPTLLFPKILWLENDSCNHLTPQHMLAMQHDLLKLNIKAKYPTC